MPPASSLLALFLLLPGLPAARAQDAAGVPALTTIASVRQQQMDGGEVRVRGVVTGIEVARVYLQDASGGIAIARPGLPPDLQAGQVIEVTGRITGQAGGKEIQPTEVRQEGTAPLPVARTISAYDLSTGGAAYQRVRISGFVHEVGMNAGGYLVQIESGGVSLVAFWPEKPLASGAALQPPVHLLDAKVEVEGVAPPPLNNPGLSRGLRLVLIDEKAVKVLRPGSPDPFTRPLIALGDMPRAKLAVGERYRYRGTVSYWSDAGWFYIQDDTGTLRVDNAHLLSQTIGWPYRAGRSQPDLKPGDVIELVGQPLGLNRERAAVSQCEWRIIGSGDPPPFLPVTAEQVATTGMHGMSVSLTGEVADLEVGIDYMGFANHKLWMQSGDVFYSALLQQRKPVALTVKKGDFVRLNGVVAYLAGSSGRQSAFRVNLNSLDAIRPAQRPVIWFNNQVRKGIYAAAAAALLAAVWIILLRRQVKAQTAQLQAQLAQEKELSEMKSRLVFTVSHEFRNPLAAIMSCSDVLQRMREKLTPAEHERQISGIQQNVRRMADMVEEVLLLGRAEAGRLPCELQPLDVASFCLKLADQIRSACRQRCPVECQAREMPRLMLDPGLLQHILGNLLSNAVKFSPAGMSVELSADFDGSTLILQVRDRGTGIPTLDRSHIFEPFQRGSNVGETPGTGLGLAITERCVRAHGGSIECESSTDEGTTFTVRIPCVTVPETPHAA